MWLVFYVHDFGEKYEHDNSITKSSFSCNHRRSQFNRTWYRLVSGVFLPERFYPGCTTQAVDFTALKPQFDALNTTIIGISRDSVKAHQNFTEKQSLGINLISDKEEVLCQLFDVIKEKNMYGKKVMGIERSTFIFHQGQLIKEYRKVKAAGHAEQVLADLTALQA